MGSTDVHLLLLGCSIGLSIAMLIDLARDADLRPASRTTAITIVVAGLAYGMISGPLRGAWPDAVRLPLRLVAGLGVPALWLLVHQLFEPASARGPATLIAAACWLMGTAVPVGLAVAHPSLDGVAGRIAGAVATALIVHMLWRLVRGRADDLESGRRRMRLMVAGGAGVYVLAIQAVALGGLRAQAPTVVLLGSTVGQIALKLAWLALVAGRVNTLGTLDRLARDPDGGAATGAGSAPAVEAPDGASAALPIPSVADAAAARHADRIVEAMQTDRLYLRPGLTIAALADHVGITEHRARALINGRLGFRNFSTFVNRYRLQEASSRLRDPAQAHLPILTVALEAGFASLGPFNRAFREAYGVTPSAYRQGTPVSAEPMSPPARSHGSSG